MSGKYLVFHPYKGFLQEHRPVARIKKYRVVNSQPF
jgi:hypothetical protein